MVDAAQSVPRRRFDNFVGALAAARAGLGVILGYMPLCEAELRDGTLVRLSKDALTLADGYWMAAQKMRCLVGSGI